MKNLDILFIRACKCSNAEKRLNSLYRRFYYKGSPKENDEHIAVILTELVERYNMERISRIIFKIAPNVLINNTDISFWKNIKINMTSIIRYNNTKKLDGFIPPGCFRNNVD